MKIPAITLGTALAVLGLSAPAAHAQQSALEPLIGTWTMELTPPGEDHAQSMPLHITVEADTLRMKVDGGPPFLHAKLEEETLSFVIDSGHGEIECALYRQDADAFSGVCVGGMGESATTLRREQDDEDESRKP
jgi:hypothetical protein